VGRGPDGRVVFVPLTAPGDRVRVVLRQRSKRFVRAELERVLEPGASRVEPICPAFGRCGGCAWQHVAYPEQLRAKAKIVADALERLAGLTVPEGVAISPSPAPYAYRGRTRVVCADGGVGYRRRGSHALCRVSTCPVLVAPLDRELGALAADPPTWDGDGPTGGGDGEWELVAGAGGTRAVPLPARPGPRIGVCVGDDRLEVSPGVFFQANTGLLEPLAAAVGAATGEGEYAVELFAGAGFLTLGLARRFARVHAVESNPAAASDLAHNLSAAGLANVEIACERVEVALSRGPLASARPSVVLLDPPRLGLPDGAAEALAGLSPQRIAYLSCDPATLARDLGRLTARGYALTRVEAFDLFPQTAHVETLAVLSRSDGH
jgi:23S rRNA (uracil1939-C5)-methyltransferase